MDSVNVPMHGLGCTPAGVSPGPSDIVTEDCSETVFANINSGGAGVVRKTDKHVLHLDPNCVDHQTPLLMFSPNVFANPEKLNVGRLGDWYGVSPQEHIISSGSPNVFVNGA